MRARRAPAAAEHALLVVVAVADVAAIADRNVLVGPTRAVGVGARGLVLLVQVREHLLSLPFAPAELLLAGVGQPRGSRREQIHQRDSLSARRLRRPRGPFIGSLERVGFRRPPPRVADLAEVRGAVPPTVHLGQRSPVEQPVNLGIRGFRRRDDASANVVSRVRLVRLCFGHHPARAVREHLGELGRSPRLRRLPALGASSSLALSAAALLAANVFHHEALDGQLGLGHGDDLLLHRLGGDELVHGDFPRLTHPVRPGLRLRVDERVKVRVVEHDSIRGRQVDALPARAGGDQEEERVRPRGVKVGDDALAVRQRRAAVYATVHGPDRSVPRIRRRLVGDDESDARGPEPVLEQVEHAGHLAEEQDAMPALPQLRQQLGEQLHLAAGAPQERRLEGIIGGGGRARSSLPAKPALGFSLLGNLLREAALPRRPKGVLLGADEQKRVIANLLQFLEHVEQAGPLPGVSALVESLVVPRQHIRVHLPLKRRQLARNLRLSHLRQTPEHVALEPAKHALAEQPVQALELRVDRLRLVVAVPRRGVSPLALALARRR